MAIPATGLAVEAYSGLISLISKPKRSLATIIADAVLEESHRDQLQLSDHPVQYGAVISDHSFRLPSEVVLTYGFSLSATTISGALTGFASLITGEIFSGNNKLNAIYAALLALQKNRVVFDVYTGRRYYPSMMLKDIALVTDKDTENAMIVRATCREILFAQIFPLPTQDPANQLSPQITASPVNVGQQALSPAAQFNPVASGL